MRRVTKRYQILTVILFGCLLLLPLLQFIFHIFPEKELSSENRAMTTRPTLKLTNLDRFPTQYDNYLSDHFPFRKTFLDVYFSYALLNQESPIPSVIIGNEDFLFSGKDEKELYTGKVDYFSEKEMDLVINELKKRENTLKQQGISFYVAIAPSAMEVYPEYLPKHLVRTSTTATDKFLQRLHQQAPELPCIYLKDALLQHKNSKLLYLKNDNHWNTLGAYYGVNAIFEKMSKDHSALPKAIVGQFQFNAYTSEEGNLANQLNLGNHFDRIWRSTNYHATYKDTIHCKIREDVDQKYEPTPGFAYPWEYEKEYYTNQQEMPSIVVVRDSYSSAAIPFFTPFFKHSLFIFDAWQYGANWDIIQNEKPDIVLLILYEPHIRNIARNLK